MVSTILFLVGGVLFLGVLGFGIFIWIRRRRYTRERFAFIALSGLITLAMIIISSILGGTTPWHMAINAGKLFFEIDVDTPTLRTTDILLIGFVLYFVATTILKIHAGWDGLVSVDQHDQEQRQARPMIFHDGISEFRQVILPRRPRKISSSQHKDYSLEMNFENISLAWKDRSRDLVRLSSSSYYFDKLTDWHDNEKCWIGKNLDTDHLVGLYPFQNAIKSEDIESCLGYLRQICAQRGQDFGELIIALEDGSVESDLEDEYKDKYVRFETYQHLLENLVDFTDYRNDIVRRVGSTTLSDSKLTLRDVYVPSQFLYPGNDTGGKNIEQYLTEWIKEPGKRQLSLLGEYGQGKSTAALMFTYKCIENPSFAHGRIPILIELRGTSPRNLSPLQLFGAWCSSYHIDAQALMQLHLANKLVLIFEGFDEMTLVGDSEMRLKHFQTIWNFCCSGCKMLVTGRPNFFLDETEMKRALGFDRMRGEQFYSEAIRLKPFGVGQMNKALRNHKHNVRDQICSLARNNSNFSEIASRPALLHIVSVLWEKEKLNEKVDLINSAYIMGLFINNSYRRQGLKQKGPRDDQALTTSERAYFMSGIACYMAAKNLPNQITASELSKLVELLIKAIPDSVSEEAPEISGEDKTPLRERIRNTENEFELSKIEHIKTDVRACGILVDDPASIGTFRFGHKSFMEYLFAEVLYENVQNKMKEKSASILNTTGASISNILGLPTSIDFFAELILSHSDLDMNLGDFQSKNVHDENTQYKVAVQIMEVLSRGKTVLTWTCQFVAFNTVFFGKRWRAFLKIQMIAVMFSAMLLTGLFKENDWVIPISMILVSLYAFSVSSISVANPFYVKLMLWRYICKDVGIVDRVMHRVVGTSAFSWIRNKPFEFFLPIVRESDTAK